MWPITVLRFIHLKEINLNNSIKIVSLNNFFLQKINYERFYFELIKFDT